MNMAKFNNIYFYFIGSQLLFLPIYFYNASLIPVTLNTDKAIWMHIIGLIWSAIGYLTIRFAYALKGEQQEERSEDRQYSLSQAFYIFAYLLTLAGTIVAVLQVILFVPLNEYISQLFGSDFEAEIRVAYLLKSDEGGLPGIIKIFAYAPLSIYLMSLGLLNFVKLSETDMRRLKILSIIALGAILIKVFFSLDRLTIMAVLLANVFIGFKQGYLKQIRYWIMIAAILFLANYLSIKRLNNVGLIDFILMYFKLGLVNFQLMIDTCSQYTYGFSTILGPVYFIFKFIHQPMPDFVNNSQYEWEWNPAQYFSSYAFQDFGYFYFILFYFIGIVLFFIDFKALEQKNINYSTIYFVVLYGVVSFLFVPAIRGIEFWFALSIPLLLNRFVHEY